MVYFYLSNAVMSFDGLLSYLDSHQLCGLAKFVRREISSWVMAYKIGWAEVDIDLALP